MIIVSLDMLERVPMWEGLKPRVSLPRSRTVDQSLECMVEEEMVLRLPFVKMILTVESSFIPG